MYSVVLLWLYMIMKWGFLVILDNVTCLFGKDTWLNLYMFVHQQSVSYGLNNNSAVKQDLAAHMRRTRNRVHLLSSTCVFLSCFHPKLTQITCQPHSVRNSSLFRQTKFDVRSMCLCALFILVYSEQFWAFIHSGHQGAACPHWLNERWIHPMGWPDVQLRDCSASAQYCHSHNDLQSLWHAPCLRGLEQRNQVLAAEHQHLDGMECTQRGC